MGWLWKRSRQLWKLLRWGCIMARVTLQAYIFDDIESFDKCISFLNSKLEEHESNLPLTCRPLSLYNGKKAFCWSSTEATQLYESLLSEKYGKSVVITTDDFYHAPIRIKL